MMEFRPLHGGQLHQVADRFGIPQSELLDFSANINPEGPPEAVLSCLRASIDDPSIITNYPDLDELELRQRLAGYAGIRPENISVANGFVPLLDATLRILNIRSCLVPVPAFVEYRRTLERSRIEMIPHILEADFGFNCHAADLFSKDRFSKELFGKSCDAMLLANPQNPSGVLSPRDTLLRIIEEASKRNVFILLDEAFIDYCPETTLTREIDRFPNLIVFRSVTKFFGMAGLRVAYATANAELRQQIHEAIAPWSITSLASLASGVAVQDEAYARHTIALNKTRRDQMHTAIAKLDIHIYPSAANFLLLRLSDSIDCQQLWERLICEHHIILRNCANYEGLGDAFLRAAVRTEAENEQLIDALAYEVEKRAMTHSQINNWEIAARKLRI
jgi:threonine-phosphate decarboxylase